MPQLNQTTQLEINSDTWIQHRLQAASGARLCACGWPGQPRRGLILPVILVVLLLMGVLAAAFSFQVQADYAAGRAMSDRFQTRMAAEAGIQAVTLMLRTQRDNMDAWYHNLNAFDQALVWAPNVSPQQIGKPELIDDVDDPFAFRFSIVADDPADDEELIRFGITDEASKLNLNTATEQQLTTLLSQTLPPDTASADLVQAILDWRDADDDVRERGAESEYYGSLDTPYRAKNGFFETVEELLMVKGFDGRVLYGEDFNRNGLLEENEKDAELTFPMDNGDGVLDRGLYPYLTVHSEELNVANNNKPRINLFMPDREQLRERLQDVFDSEEIVEFIVESAKNEGTNRIFSLADLLKTRIVNDFEVPSPIAGDAVTRLFDQCTLNASPQAVGLININTAPPIVLRCIPNLSETKIPLIVQKRAELSGFTRSSVGWLVNEKILDADEFRAVQDFITARGRQFTIESIGFADHTGIFTRLQVIVDLRGPLSQIVYYRDISKLGLAYPIRGREGERRLVLKNG